MRKQNRVARAFQFGALIGTILAPALWAMPKKSWQPNLSLRDMSGARQHLRDLRGRIVVLNFWATWCDACKAEMPILVHAQRDYAAQGVVIGASLDNKSTRGKIPAFVQNYHIDFLIWVGATVDDLENLGLGHALPATAFLDREGSVIARVLGELREQELKERLEWLIGDRTGPAPKPVVNHLDTK